MFGLHSLVWDVCNNSQILRVIAVICGFVADSESRVLTLIRPPSGASVDLDPTAMPVETGLADVVTLQRRRQARMSAADEESFFVDSLSEYQWARDAAGLAPSTLDGLIKPVIEVCEYYGTVPWQLSPREVDRYFAGPGKRAQSTLRSKINKIDAYFAFLEQRYAGEIMRRFGATIESPIDPFNRPRHRGDFGLRVPPSQQAMKEFFARWREQLPLARKYAVACRDYVMSKIAYISGVRAAELCPVCIGDVHWEHGQWGRFLVNGKGANGSGPRQREAYLFQDGRELLWWYIEEVRGEFGDDATHPRAPLWPSERKPKAVAALNLPIAPAIVPSTFRAHLHDAASSYLTGPVSDLYPHLLRHVALLSFRVVIGCNWAGGLGVWPLRRGVWCFYCRRS